MFKPSSLFNPDGLAMTASNTTQQHKRQIQHESYLHQIPSLQGLCDDGGHGRADATEDHQVFGTVAYGIKEGPQPLGVVTLQAQRDTRKGGERRHFD